MTVGDLLSLRRNSARIGFIVETGCRSAVEIAEWVDSLYHDCPLTGLAPFASVSLDIDKQAKAHVRMEKQNLARYCIFHTQDPSLFLARQKWIDVAFLEPADLRDGKLQFDLAASAGAHTIVFYNYQTQAALAIRFAQGLGWTLNSSGDLLILTRSI